MRTVLNFGYARVMGKARGAEADRRGLHHFRRVSLRPPRTLRTCLFYAGFLFRSDATPAEPDIPPPAALGPACQGACWSNPLPAGPRRPMEPERPHGTGTIAAATSEQARPDSDPSWPAREDIGDTDQNDGIDRNGLAPYLDINTAPARVDRYQARKSSHASPLLIPRAGDGRLTHARRHTSIPGMFLRLSQIVAETRTHTSQTGRNFPSELLKSWRRGWDSNPR